QVILLWLGLEGVNRKQKEEFIEALLGFKDKCNNFYGYRAYFLAAAGIAEFKDCSRADEIVATIIKWGFGYFNIEKQEWGTFLAPIEETAKKTLLQTDGQRAIQELSHLLKHSQCSEDTRWCVAKSLSKVDPGNPQAIADVVGVLKSTEDKFKHWDVAQYLLAIDHSNYQAIAILLSFIETPENTIQWRSIQRGCANYLKYLVEKHNPQAISALVKIIKTTKQKRSFVLAADSLEGIAQGNPQAIDALVKVIETNEDEDIRLKAATSLGIIDPGNAQAISILVRLIDTNKNENSHQAIYSLREIGQGNPQAIDALVKVIETNEDEDIRLKAATSLGIIDPGNAQAISILVRLIDTNKNENSHQAIYSLREIGQGNPQAIDAFIKVIETNEDEDTRLKAATSLGIIDPGNAQALAAVVRLIETTENQDTCRWAVNSLEKIGQGNSKAIATLVRLLETNDNEDTCRWAASSLGKIATGNPKAIAALIGILSATTDKDTLNQIAYSLNEIVQNDQMPSVVSALQQFQSNTTYETNFDLYKDCFEIIGNCAQNLPYPTFYQAWHHQLTTPHPEVPETTGVGSTPFTQSLNLAELPKIIEARLVETQLIESLQLICIDTSKFIDSHNPALDIYEQFLDQNCPERLNGEPETLPQLKSYWNRLRRDSDKHHILIFYQDPTSPAAQGLSPTFLDALIRFDGTICLITDTPHPPLQTFSPHDPDLLQCVVNWLKRLHLES
ncbi:HEAT repeat domain-containing protein, partial [Microcoleus sp. herbarium8]|uniref:HEAT repeat domain-containing protein n=1 Tax=Microcoleus sp. herbarium8 TaxID=3055436 RepID=UPI002FD31AD5